MATASCSFTATPRFLRFLNQRASRSSPALLLHLAGDQSSFRSRLVSAGRTSSGDSATKRLSTGAVSLSRRPGTAVACTTTAAAMSLENLVPSSVLSGAPMLLGALVPLAFTVYLSKKLNLGLEKEIYVAMSRATIQLSTLGFALKLVFEKKSVAWSIFAMMIMLVVAGQTAGERSKLLPRSKLVSTVALVMGGIGTISLMLLLKVLPTEPRYLIPATGYFVGNSMTMVANTLICMQRDIHLHEQEIEAALALGATPYEAVKKHLRRALVTGLGPVLDSMKVSGLVTLPGAMTGMLMSGSHPLEAVRFSLVLIYMLVGACSLSSVIGAQLGWRSLFTGSFQLLKTS